MARMTLRRDSGSRAPAAAAGLLVFIQSLYEYKQSPSTPAASAAQKATPSDATKTCSLEPGLNQ
jgi:hypothetical protein